MKNFQKIDDLLFAITKKIFKHHDKKILLLLNNWEFIVGKNFSNSSHPIKISKNGVLIIHVSYEYILDFQYQSPKIINKINSLLKDNIIYKIKVIQKD